MPISNQIAELERELFPDDTWSANSIADILISDINDVIVLQQDKQILGYCLYQIVFETAEILRIGVKPNLQHQGIGTQIFSQLLEILNQKQVENLILEVRADNQNAINFYQKQGFNLIHIRKNYYQLSNGKTMNALIMQKLLT